MKVFQGASKIKGPLRNVVMTIGNFDGVHTGHAAILKKVTVAAKKLKGTSLVYTFEPHPAKAVSPLSSLKLIQTREQKLSQLKKRGIDCVVIEPFNPKFASTSPAAFFEKVIQKKIAPVKIIVGYDLTFGKRRAGTIKTLERLCKKNRITLEVVPVQLSRETIVSSTQIRNFVSTGKIKEANRLLGRTFSLTGKVVRGFGRGARMGIPTANIVSNNELIPAAGVYATMVSGHPAVTNIGFNPTFGGNPLSIETHIIGFKKNIYGKTIEIEFFDRIRDEEKFSSPWELRLRIKDDIARAKKALKGIKK